MRCPLPLPHSHSQDRTHLPGFTRIGSIFYGVYRFSLRQSLIFIFSFFFFFHWKSVTRWLHMILLFFSRNIQVKFWITCKKKLCKIKKQQIVQKNYSWAQNLKNKKTLNTFDPFHRRHRPEIQRQQIKIFYTKTTVNLEKSLSRKNFSVLMQNHRKKIDLENTRIGQDKKISKSP